MKTIGSLLSLLLCLSLQAFEIEYEKKLSKDEEAKLLKIAESMGIESVEKIRVYNIHPGPDYVITIYGDEERYRRQITGKSMTVWNPAWVRKPKGIEKEGFYVEGIKSYKKFILKVSDREYLVSDVGDLSIKECDQMLAAFLSGRSEYDESIDLKKYQGMDFTKPNYFGYSEQKKMYVCGFSHKTSRLSGYMLAFEFKNNKVYVKELSQWIS